MEADERARAGMFLAFQYPVELPGVGGMSFLRAAVNARRIDAGEDEIDQLEFVKLVRAKAKHLSINDEMLKRLSMLVFLAVRKSVMRFYKWPFLSQRYQC